MKLVIFIFLLNLVRYIETDETTNRGLSWYESLPAVAMDYKVHIDAGNLKILPYCTKICFTSYLFK